MDNHSDQPIINNANIDYIERLYTKYLKDPSKVDKKWYSYFEQFQSDPNYLSQASAKQSLVKHTKQNNQLFSHSNSDASYIEKQAAVFRLIEAYRMSGHQAADLCPVNLRERKIVPELSPEFYGLTQSDLNTKFNTGTLTNNDYLTLQEILNILTQTYTQHIGVEFMHITNTEERNWIQNKLEDRAHRIELSTEDKLETLNELIAAEGLERYLHTRYVGQKRFSLEGSDALIPMMHKLIDDSSKAGAEEIVIGMAHRGRLNVLVNILGKAPQDLFDEFEGKKMLEKGSGDVKYHMGFSSSVQTKHGSVHLGLMFNPSHLEIVDPVTEGSARARLERRAKMNDPLPFNTILPILIHGDAAFAGQGVVMETLQLSEVRGYRCGGTVHIVVNNQIGFTTSNPLDIRSASYCTDVAKMIQAPIFHVNGDDPEAVKYVAGVAIAYRQKFNKDIVIDLVSYRRLGHNEADEPSATQPMMYKKINNHQSPARVYANKLIEENIITAQDFEAYSKKYKERLEEGQSVGYPSIPPINSKYSNEWAVFLKNNEEFGTAQQRMPKTTISTDMIKKISEKISILPDNFLLHPRVQRIFDDRKKMAAGALPIDWGFAETLAYASLIIEGHPVRISGQDAGRGTFFHRHAVFHNQIDGSSYIPLQNLTEEQARFTVIDSILSEAAVLGFEYGYAATEPDTLTIWEAQFGDFANGAQVVIDQFISSGETKWMRLSGVTLLLPHGYEGQGPEHSSARPERFLQLCAENNMSVAVPTTPAQIFHLLRKQALQNYRKPLICFTPKSLLRHKSAVNSLEDFTKGEFLPIIPDHASFDNKKVTHLIISIGRIFYDLSDYRDNHTLDDTTIIRLEKIYPFPIDKLKEIIENYRNLTAITIVQDEPINQGYIGFIQKYIDVFASKKIAIRYVSRPESSSPAVGYPNVHNQQLQNILEETFKI